MLLVDDDRDLLRTVLVMVVICVCAFVYVSEREGAVFSCFVRCTSRARGPRLITNNDT